MQKFLASIKQMIFPNLCVCCESYLSHQENFICDMCQYTLPKFEQIKDINNAVSQVFWGRVQLNFATAMLSFGERGNVKRILHEIKYKKGTALGTFMGEWMGKVMQEQVLFDNVDLIISIPLHPKKQLLRGYNQCDLLVQGITNITKINKANDVLIRTKHNATQTKKKRYERFINTSEIFSVQEPQKVAHKHILLIDDVITTGATIEAAAGALLEVEGVRVSVFSLAKA